MRVKLSLMVFTCLLGSALAAPRVIAQAGGRINVPAPPAPAAVPVAPTAPTPPTPPTAPAAAPRPQVSFKVDFVLTRFQGEKKLSSLPYSILLSEGGRSTLRSGSNVPIPNAGKEGGITYQSVGVNITIISIVPIVPFGDGRYNISLNFDDSSVMDSNAPGASTLGPVIRSNSFSSSVLVREGQPLQFSVATDKVSGETLKAELTLTVLK